MCVEKSGITLCVSARTGRIPESLRSIHAPFFRNTSCLLKSHFRDIISKLSANSRKLNLRIARVHQRIADTRKDWHFKTAHSICDHAGMIFVEDLDFRIMAKGMLGKHTLDAWLGQFTNQILPWVCFKRVVYDNESSLI